MPQGLHPVSRRTALALLAGGALALSANPAAAGDAALRAPRLNRGFNLPDWAEREDGRAPSIDVLVALRHLGFGAVRLPINADLFSLGDDDTRRVAAARLTASIAQLTALGYSVTVDLHPAEQTIALLGTDPETASTALDSAWQILSDVVARFSPDDVFPELLNEPPLDRTLWVPLRDRLAATVRQRCPDHTLIWGAARYQGIWETLDTPRLPDANAIAAVHYYTPLGFTHQCESWGGSPLERLRDLPFPATRNSAAVKTLHASLRNAGDDEALATLEQEFSSPWSLDVIAADFADIARWSRRNDCPVILNEFGVLNFCVDPESRARWTRGVREAAERSGVAWTYWELDQGFGFSADRQDPASFDLPLIDALLG